MRKFAFFLPQFHRIPENDKWWGEGFSEWVNVKKAKPLYKGHCQPKAPLDGRYYNLLDKDTVLWQTELMHKYNIQGFIYYHYWFNGKLLLEKPAENLLKWTEVDQPFFFCWANHSWLRSWNGTSEMLLEQSYGTESDWEKHFLYLLPFFKDKRYEKKGNKPLLMLFNGDFKEKNEMLDYFDKRCKDECFDGIYIIETISIGRTQKLENVEKLIWEKTARIFLREPSMGYYFFTKKFHLSWCWLRNFLNFLGRKFFKVNRLRIYNGDSIYGEMIKHAHGNLKYVPGMFFEWDNTPRHKERGYVITPVTKKLFLKYAKAIANQDYVFINAWNEWAEGMILEPTEENGYTYLEWIRDIIK